MLRSVSRCAVRPGPSPWAGWLADRCGPSLRADRARSGSARPGSRAWCPRIYGACAHIAADASSAALRDGRPRVGAQDVRLDAQHACRARSPRRGSTPLRRGGIAAAAGAGPVRVEEAVGHEGREHGFQFARAQQVHQRALAGHASMRPGHSRTAGRRPGARRSGGRPAIARRRCRCRRGAARASGIARVLPAGHADAGAGRCSSWVMPLSRCVMMQRWRKPRIRKWGTAISSRPAGRLADISPAS